MAKCFIQDTTLTAIGDAIRAKTGRTDLMLPSAMPDAIAGIVSGGGSGDYAWSIQHSGPEVSEDTTAGTYTLTTADSSKPSSEIEYTDLFSYWTWKNVTSGTFKSVYYGNGIWVAGSYDSNGLYYSTDGKTWTQSNITSGNFYSVYYANGIWVGGSNAGLYYSTDGMTWTQSNVTSGGFYSIYYVNGIWVAAGNGLCYSTDGMTWTQSNQTSNGFYSVYYSNGVWAAGGSSAGLYYSTDGMSWTQSNVTNGNFRSVYYGNGIWVASSYSKGLYYSSDGMNWTQSNVTSGSFWSVYYSNGIWVAAGDGLYSSTDGMTWTQRYQVSGGFYSVYYANGIWIAGAKSNAGIYYSTNGTTWIQSNRTTGGFESVYYGDGIWVAASSQGNGLYYMTVGKMTFNTETKLWEMSNSTVTTLTNADNTVPTLGAAAYVRLTSEPNVWYLATGITAGSSSPYSKTLAYKAKYTAALDVADVELIADDDSMKYPDGGWLDGLYYTAFDVSSSISDWAQSNVTSGYFKSVHYANGIWVGACNTGSTGLWYSTDGMSWAQSNVTSGIFYKVYYGNGIWVACRNSSGLWYSTDGMTWTQSGQTLWTFYDVYYANNLWVSIGNKGVYYSNDGITWSHQLSLGCKGLCYGNGVWVVGTDSNGVYYSTDGMTWTQSNIDSILLNTIYYANGIFVGGSSGGTGLYYSTDGVTWAQSSISNYVPNSIYYANGIWVVGFEAIGIKYSTDGITWEDTNISDDDIRSVYYANGIWVAGGVLKYYYSIDGINWSKINNTGNIFYDFYYHKGVFVAAEGNDKGLFYSKITQRTLKLSIPEVNDSPRQFVVTKDIPEIKDVTGDESMSDYYLIGSAEVFPIIVNGKTYSDRRELKADFSGVYLSTTTSTETIPNKTFVTVNISEYTKIKVYYTGSYEGGTIPAFTLVITCVE